MPRPDVQPLREILHAAFKRYLTVRPLGFELQPGEPPRPTLEARIVSSGADRPCKSSANRPAARSKASSRTMTPAAPVPPAAFAPNAPRSCASTCSSMPNPFACSSLGPRRKTFSSTRPAFASAASRSRTASIASR